MVVCGVGTVGVGGVGKGIAFSLFFASFFNLTPHPPINCISLLVSLYPFHPADLINLTLEYHSPRNEPQAFLVLAAALSPKAASAPSDGTDLAQLLLQARETWEVCRPDVLPPSNVRRLRHWQQMMDASQALEAELQRGEGPVTAPVEEGAYNLGSDGAPTTDLMAGALQLLSALLQPEWWEHQVADHTSRSLVPTAEEADVQSARQQPPSSQRSRSRAFLTTCLWLETFAAVAQVRGTRAGNYLTPASSPSPPAFFHDRSCNSIFSVTWLTSCTCWRCI